ncbi:hypothetical protein AB4Z22_43040, partial [Paenibacillus sp. TAF58]
QALSLAFFLQFLVAPVSQTLIINGAQATQFAWDTTRVVVVILAIYGAFAIGWGPLAAVWAYSIASFLCYAALWLLCYRKARMVDRAQVAQLEATSRTDAADTSKEN